MWLYVLHPLPYTKKTLAQVLSIIESIIVFARFEGTQGPVASLA